MPERFIGQTLGKFRIDALLGSGGFAWVYRAYDPELDIPVALKVLKPHYAGDERFESRFRREASTAARLRHPNIVKIYAIGREKDAVYFAMDFLPQSLSSRLDVMTTLPEALLLRMSIDVASALAFAHREGVIHRDIKPDNILFDEHGNAVVADFGIARALWGYVKQTGTNMVVGTPQYFAPEQARGQELDGRADLYALGVTMFRCSTGRLPFEGEDWYEIARQHVEEPPPPPRSINPKISRELERVILRLMAKDREQRFANGDELSAVLGTLLQQHDSGASTSLRSLPPHVTDPSMAVLAPNVPLGRRTGMRKVVYALGALVVLGGIGTAWHLGQRAAASERGPDSASAVPGVLAESAAAGSAGALRGTGGVAAAGDSLRRATLEQRLKVRAPSGATVFLDGKEVGRGDWGSDTVSVGPHVLAAEVQASPDCPSRRIERRVEVTDTGSRTVSLPVRACGTLRIEPSGASGGSYTLVAAAGSLSRQGSWPPGALLTLPTGTYRLSVDADGYTPFQSTVTITAGADSVKAPRLLKNR